MSPTFGAHDTNSGEYFTNDLVYLNRFVLDFGAPYREKNKSKYYHRKYRRVTPIEDCYEDDAMCWFEAFHQYNRDRYGLTHFSQLSVDICNLSFSLRSTQSCTF